MGNLDSSSERSLGTEAAELRPEALDQSRAHADEVAAAGVKPPDPGREVIDRSAAPAGEAVPTPSRGRVDVQARALIPMKRTAHLAIPAWPGSEEVLHVDGQGNPEESVSSDGSRRASLPTARDPFTD